jgi:hypothetical protein
MLASTSTYYSGIKEEYYPKKFLSTANVKFRGSILNISVLLYMNQIGFNTIMLKLKTYVKENWGSPFIVGFMAFLVTAAVSLSFGLPSIANSVTIYAYYALVAGIFLQLVCFMKNGKKRVNEVAV